MKVPYPEQFDFPNLQNYPQRMIENVYLNEEIKEQVDFLERGLLSHVEFADKIIKIKKLYGI